MSIVDSIKTRHNMSIVDSIKTRHNMSVMDSSEAGCYTPVVDNTKTGHDRYVVDSTETGEDKIHTKACSTDMHDAVPKKGSDYQGVLSKGRNNLSLKAFLIFFFIMFGCCDSSQGTTLYKPEQKLPDDCVRLLEMRGYDCPMYDTELDFQSVYREFNGTCCGSYPGKEYHCQTSNDASGNMYTMLGCMPSVDLGKNLSGRISYDTPSSPVFLTETLSGWRASSKMSWQETRPHDAPKRSQCHHSGEERLCAGDHGEDDRCTCLPGFQPTPEMYDQGFTHSDPAHCIVMTCPSGFHGVRSFIPHRNVSCKELINNGFHVNFMCEKLPHPPTTIRDDPLRTTTLTPDSDMTTALTETPKLDNDPDKPAGTETGTVIGIVFGVAVLLVIAVLVYCFREKIMCCRGNPAVNQASPADYQKRSASESETESSVSLTSLDPWCSMRNHWPCAYMYGTCNSKSFRWDLL